MDTSLMAINSPKREPFATNRSNDVNWGELAANVARLGYWRLEIASNELIWSDALFKLYGLEAGDAQGLEVVLGTLHEDDRQSMEHHVRRAMASHEARTDQARLRRADGAWRIFSHHTVCRRLSNGAPETVFGVVMDVTERETYRVLAENGNDLNDLIIQSDMHGLITYVSPSVVAVTGFTPQEVLGAQVGVLITAAREVVAPPIIDAVEASQGSRSVCAEMTLCHKHGHMMWLEARRKPLLDPATGIQIGITDVVRDITERKSAEAKLEFANILLKTQMEASPDGIVAIDADLRTISFNQRFAKMWDIAPEELVLGERFAALPRMIAALKGADSYSAGARHFHDNPFTDGRADVETIDGRTIDCYTVPLLALDDENLGRAWFFNDVTSERQSLAQAQRAAGHDVLTDLFNRAVFVDSLHRAIGGVERGGKGFAVIYLDLDHFKDVNDTLGHLAGDQLLCAVAKRLRTHTRAADTVARFGGDEFAIIVTDTSDEIDVAILAEKLITVISEPFCMEGTQVYTGASIGIDVFGPEAADAETLLSHADLALYAAKALGRGSYQFFNDSMDSEVRGRVTLAAELHQAIADDQLFLLFQPRMSVVTRRITGLEALVRWRHPRLGILAPDDFVPTAERMGLMPKLGTWVLKTALGQARAWLDAGLPLPRVCVKLSATQFKAPLALEDAVAAALAETGFPPERLELELTEAAIMTASRKSSEVLPRVRRMGVTIAIDEFGSGYSSLHHLRRFPVDRIKIAEVFIRDLEITPEDAAIVRATIDFARGLGVAVLAAGVDTPAQFDLLKRWNCAEAQGSAIARPLEAMDVPSMFVEGCRTC